MNSKPLKIALAAVGLLALVLKAALYRQEERERKAQEAGQ